MSYQPNREKGKHHGKEYTYHHSDRDPDNSRPAYPADLLDLPAQIEPLKTRVSTEEEKQILANIIESTEQQINHHMVRLQAVETMYHIETGFELGLIAEV